MTWPRRLWPLLLLAACEGPASGDEPATPDRNESPRVVGEGPRALASASEPRPSSPATTPPAWRDRQGGLVQPTHWLPGPATPKISRDPDARHAAELGCRRCHAEAAHGWEASRHARAWTSPDFLRAFADEPRAFCQRCHAPEEDASTPVGQVTDAAADLGVGCVTCHVQPLPRSRARSRAHPGTYTVLAAPRSDAESIDARAPHPIDRRVAFAGPQACAACHEFSFPDGLLREHPLAMQSTVSEHARSASADRSCAWCHMPRLDSGRRSHAFPGAYDRSLLASALDVHAARPTPTEISVRLSPGAVGHAVPTGDLLRRLEVEVTVHDDEGTEAFVARHHYSRHFGPVRQAQGITVRGERWDDRVGVGPDEGVRVARFVLPESLADRPARWRVLHQRVAQGSADPRRAPIAGELTMASGQLQPR